MSWSRFKFYCREVSRLLERGEELSTAFEKSRNSALSKEFGPELKPYGVQFAIISSVMTGRLSIEEVKSALKIYDGLDIQELIHKPSRIRRVGIYIGYLTFMYFLFSGIYSVYVIPEALTMFETLGTPPPSQFLWFVENWSYMTVAIIFLLFFTFLISRNINSMFEYKVGMEGSLVYRFFISNKIKKSHQRLMSLLRTPLELSKSDNDGVNDHIVQYYISESYSDTEIAQSLSLVIGENVSQLLMLSESYLQRIYVVVVLLIVFSIYQFVSSAYIPLFLLGTVA